MNEYEEVIANEWVFKLLLWNELVEYEKMKPSYTSREVSLPPSLSVLLPFATVCRAQEISYDVAENRTWDVLYPKTPDSQTEKWDDQQKKFSMSQHGAPAVSIVRIERLEQFCAASPQGCVGASQLEHSPSYQLRVGDLLLYVICASFLQL